MTVQSGTIDLTRLAEELVSGSPRLDATEQRIAVALYRPLAEGEPVSTERLAERVGLSPDRVTESLDGWPGVFRDGRGRVVGFWGLAQPEMPHRFEVDGRQLYTWCAWDSLFLPQILGRSARVESKCPVTGRSVALTVGPEGVEEASPPGAVLSFLRPESGFDADVIQNFCHFVLFFASDDAARQWAETRPSTFLLSIAEGFELGRLWSRGNFGTALARPRPR